jgi:hypothetical protein
LWLCEQIDAYKAAENSMFNVHRKPQPAKGKVSTSASGGGAGAGSNGSRAAQKPAVKTLADLGSD